MYRCLKTVLAEWRSQWAVSPAETLIYVASDEPSLRRNAMHELQEDGFVTYDMRHHDEFTQTDTLTDPVAWGRVLSEWWLLGEQDYLIGSGTTFSVFAGMRTNTPTLAFTAFGAPLEKCHVVSGSERYWSIDTRVGVR